MKCHWCHEEVSKEDVFTYEYTNKNGNFTRQKGHEKCFVEAQKAKREKDSLEEYLMKVEEIPALTSIMRKHIKSLNDKGYTNEVIRKAISISEDAIKRHLEKGWLYHYAIIQNNLPSAIKLVKEDERKAREHKVQDLRVDSFSGLDMSRAKVKTGKDYSSLL